MKDEGEFCFFGVKKEFSLAPGLRPNNKPMHTNPEGVIEHRRGCQPPGKGRVSVCQSDKTVVIPNFKISEFFGGHKTRPREMCL